MMKPILIVYASISGNTEMIADLLANAFRELEHEVVIKSFDFDVIDVMDLDNYEAVVVGTYTWDNGELPYEVEDFYIDLEIAPIKNKLLAFFGSADSCYDTFGRAIDLLAERALQLNADVLSNRLKIDLFDDKEDKLHIKQFVTAISNHIKKKAQIL